MAMTAAWLEVLDISGVPVEQYEACYSSAVQSRAERRANGEQLSHLTADELAAEWIKIRRLHDEMEREGQKVRMLAENAVSQCQRCFGKKPAADSCDHVPLTEEEKRKQAEAYAENARQLREMLAKKPAIHSMPVEDSKMDLSVTYTCIGCGRKVKSEFGWNYHDRCNARLPGPVRDKESLGCRGVMEVL
jgi:hypothetical protein